MNPSQKYLLRQVQVMQFGRLLKYMRKLPSSLLF
jgi:hypothetical protein